MYSPFTKLGNWVVLCLILLSVSITITICSTLDSITPSQALGYGNTLVSADTNFELGFFSLADPSRRYLGIWFKNISLRTYVWVANRDTPLFSNASATLNITNQGNLVLVDFRNDVFWSSNTSIRTGQVPVAVAELLNSGNFVVRDANDTSSENFLWQSFDYPGNTLLPGMKLGADLQRGINRFLTAWTSTDDPAANRFSLQIDLCGYPQLVVVKESNFLYRPGSWNGVMFTGAYAERPNPIYTNEFVINKNEVYYKYELKNRSVFATAILNPTGLLQRFTWSYERNEWMTAGTAPIDQCENYGFCGAFANCNSSGFSQCSCLHGFIPKSQSDPNAGCTRRIPLNCSVQDGFAILKGIKLPDTSSSWHDKSIDLAQCRKLCLNNCSCSAYATLNISGRGSGCLQWRSDLVDLRTLPESGQDIYIRLSASELGRQQSYLLKVGTIAGSVIFSIIIMLLFLYRRQIRQYVTSKTKIISHFEEIELPLFSLTEISEATNGFSSDNKIGEGGFGPVYKGRLMDSQEIAVKRLSKSSRQGLKEFENEVKLIAKLQHRNLVKLLGCCIHEDENMLIYEYMPNRSLDFFIFDEKRSKFLDWKKRFHIINGIARGLVYLHRDSRLNIIHRDLKTSNILLDENMNPKISDFGLARLFDTDQSEAETTRVVGTYGYMSPEYAVDGVFSIKSDVFSYGVMVLEIVSGMKNRGFCHPGHDRNLLGHAYMQWIEGTPTEIVDQECLANDCSETQVVRCINIGLLCVQQRPEDRPNMGWVVVMLSSQNPLPEPKEPGFFMPRNPLPLSPTSTSVNQLSSSLFEPR